MLTRTRNSVPKLNVQLIHIALYLDTFTLTCNVDELKILMDVKGCNARSSLCAPSQAHIIFFLPARANSRYKRVQTGLLGTKGHLVPGFLGKPLLQALFHSNVHCILTEGGSKKLLKQALLQGKEIFLFCLSLNFLCAIKGG